ncbi:hypothetical protein BCR42DRAFT_404941, partial [Absidia repens]
MKNSPSLSMSVMIIDGVLIDLIKSIVLRSVNIKVGRTGIYFMNGSFSFLFLFFFHFFFFI